MNFKSKKKSSNKSTPLLLLCATWDHFYLGIALVFAEFVDSVFYYLFIISTYMSLHLYVKTTAKEDLKTEQHKKGLFPRTWAPDKNVTKCHEIRA